MQANSISDAFHNAFGLPKLAVGLVTAAVAAFIFLGGVRRIASFTEKVVPIMALFYIIGCTALLVINHEAVPEALRMIFTSAFSTQAVVGGAAGISVQQQCASVWQEVCSAMRPVWAPLLMPMPWPR